MFKKYVSIISIIVTSALLIAQDDFGDFGDEQNESDDQESGLITITGTVNDTNGNALAGANVVVDETDLGAASDGEGSYTIEGVEVGASVTATMIGYEDETAYADGETLDFSLNAVVIELNALEVLASRAGDNTPVAYTNISKTDLFCIAVIKGTFFFIIPAFSVAISSIV